MDEFMATIADPLKYKLLHIQEQIKSLLGSTGHNPEGYKSE